MNKNSVAKKESRKAYEDKSFKYQNVCFKIEEMKEIEEHCKTYGIAKNTLIRRAVMDYIGKPIAERVSLYELER